MKNYVSATPSSRGGKSFQSEGNTPHNFSNNTSLSKLSCMTFESIPGVGHPGVLSSTSDTQNSYNFNQVPTTTPDLIKPSNKDNLYENANAPHMMAEPATLPPLVAPRVIKPAYSFASNTNTNNFQSFSFSQQQQQNNNNMTINHHRPPSVQQSTISHIAESVVTTTTIDGKKETTIGGGIFESDNNLENVEFDMYSVF